LINLLKNFFEKTTSQKDEFNDKLELLCGLMIEAANSDGQVEDKEVSEIHKILVNTFGEDEAEVEKKLKKAIHNKDNAKSLFYYTSKINKYYSDETKILLIETLWEIVLSDGKLHDYESSLIRRLSGLLYISDVSSGNARKRVLDKLRNKS
tara:strand:+ start:396 stop:848 length:453 start_codon:yes stop_codon:yes gene_type:complete